MKRLLESELDAIRKDPTRDADERLDAHLELERRDELRRRTGVGPRRNWFTVADKGNA